MNMILDTLMLATYDADVVGVQLTNYCYGLARKQTVLGRNMIRTMDFTSLKSRQQTWSASNGMLKPVNCDTRAHKLSHSAS
jgi:hypothetical protein